MSSSHPVPVGQPLPGASLGQATGRFFRGYFTFSGRASRSEFWWAMLVVWLLSIVPLVPAMLLSATLASWGEPGGMGLVTPEEAQLTVTAFFAFLGASILVSLLATIPTFAVMWRRLQDANFHGAWILLSFVGLSIVPLVICFFDSNPAGARFGPTPPVRSGFGFPPEYSHASPAMVRQQRFGAPSHPVQQSPAPAPSYGGYGGAAYGGTPYGQPRRDPES